MLGGFPMHVEVKPTAARDVKSSAQFRKSKCEIVISKKKAGMVGMVWSEWTAFPATGMVEMVFYRRGQFGQLGR